MGAISPQLLPLLSSLVVIRGPAGTMLRGSIPEVEQKAHTHSCIAMSAKCTGNNDLFFLTTIRTMTTTLATTMTMTMTMATERETTYRGLRDGE